MSSKYALNPHALVRFLEKDAKDFTKDDIIRYEVRIRCTGK